MATIVELHAGIAQRERRQLPPAGDAGLESRARSNFSAFLQASTAGLHHEAAAFAAGLKDGEEGAAFRPLPDWSPERLRDMVRSGDQAALNQVFSYARGFARSQLTRGLHHAL